MNKPEFPKIEKHQVLVFKTNKNTGHLLDLEGNRFGANESFYKVFDSAKEAEQYSITELKKDQETELVLINSDEKVLKYI